MGDARLDVLERHDLDIEEASGLAYHADQRALYVVSDRQGRVLRVSLDDFSSQRIRLEGAKGPRPQPGPRFLSSASARSSSSSSPVSSASSLPTSDSLGVSSWVRSSARRRARG